MKNKNNLFCKTVNMKRKKIKVTANVFAGICFGVTFPMTLYVDMSISILCFNMSFKWRKR